jgi:hypothetical protein
VPEWLHIGAYPHAFANCSYLGLRYETPATEGIRCWPEPKTGLIALQKVVGSNPISRFTRKPRSGGLFCIGRAASPRRDRLTLILATPCCPNQTDEGKRDNSLEDLVGENFDEYEKMRVR